MGRGGEWHSAGRGMPRVVLQLEMGAQALVIKRCFPASTCYSIILKKFADEPGDTCGIFKQSCLESHILNAGWFEAIRLIDQNSFLWGG